jgi:hypothetical protein
MRLLWKEKIPQFPTCGKVASTTELTRPGFATVEHTAADGRAVG